MGTPPCFSAIYEKGNKSVTSCFLLWMKILSKMGSTDLWEQTLFFESRPSLRREANLKMRVVSPYDVPTLKCLSIGTPNTTTFPFVPNGKWWLLGVPIIEHIIIRL